jgi:hypothetical protein
MNKEYKMGAERIKELKKEYKLAESRLKRANNPEQEAKAVAQITVIYTELTQLNANLAQSGSNRRVRVKKHTWNTQEILTAYVIYRFHGHSSALSRQISTQVGDDMGMGADSMHMKVSAFWSHLESDGSWGLCEAGVEIALKYKDMDKYEVETLTGRVVAF